MPSNSSLVFKWLFYTVKPLIPRRVQISLRRRIAARQRGKYSHLWPIDPNSGQAPEGWKGWPEGKQFALVLSHDVDTLRGYENVLKVAELEERMGLRSCFNFVPERYGKVSLDLLDRLRGRGFDVAVHGLKHDGKLFLSKSHFDRQSLRINAHLKKWRTEGFTSPSMQRNLEWMTALNIDYSTSTFDTDPFEPQPEGVGTIFPFVVSRESVQCSACPVELRRQPDYSTGGFSVQPPSQASDRRPPTADRKTCQHPATSTRNPASSIQDPESSSLASRLSSLPASPPSGCVASSPSSLPTSQLPSSFVELPYTLPQDSTLFVILLEKTIDIWKSKLDWIAEKGGMALLNTHPDYMNGGRRWGSEEYPMRFYEEFLGYVKGKYEGRYWHALPKEVARFWREKMIISQTEEAGKLGS